MGFWNFETKSLCPSFNESLFHIHLITIYSKKFCFSVYNNIAGVISIESCGDIHEDGNIEMRGKLEVFLKDGSKVMIV